MNAVHPDAGLAYWIMRPGRLSLAHMLNSVGGPGLQGERHLVWFQKMEKADLAAGECFRFVECDA